MECHPKFIRPILNDLLSLMTEIMDTTSLSDEIRITATNGIYTLSVTNAVQIRKNELFKTKTVPALVKMIADVEKVSLDDWN